MIPQIVQESTESARYEGLGRSLVGFTRSDCANDQYTVVQKMHSMSRFTSAVQSGDRFQSVSACRMPRAARALPELIFRPTQRRTRVCGIRLLAWIQCKAASLSMQELAR